MWRQLLQFADVAKTSVAAVRWSRRRCWLGARAQLACAGASRAPLALPRAQIDEDSSWPLLFDDFVAWMRKK